MSDLNAPFDDYRTQLLAVRQDAQKLVDGLSRSQGNWRPDDKGWSIAQCLDHLRAVDGAYGRALQEGLEAAAKKGLEPDGKPVRYGFFERKFIEGMEPPPKARLKAPKAIVPPVDLDLAVISEKFFEKNDRLVEMLELASAVHPKKAKIRSPLIKLLKLTIAGAYGILAAHDRRHLWQAWQVRNQIGFPPQ